MEIEYKFGLEGDKELTFCVDLDRKPNESEWANAPEWTALGFQKCPSCPLATTPGSRCPTAVDVTKIVGDFASLLSYHQALVTVSANEREIRRKCDVQVGLKSLMGLVMATSACPVLSGFSGMAHFHLPFSSLEETIVRTVSFYLLKKLYGVWDGDAPSFDLGGLKSLYDAVEKVNTSFLERIRAAAKLDANLNAILELYADANLVKSDLEDILREIKPIIMGN